MILTQKQKEVGSIIVLVIVLIGNAFFLHFNAFRCFNFFDMGGFLDASWRIFCGQRPYVDFIYTSGPMHLYMNAFFFGLFGGFGKGAVLAHLIVVHSIVITTTFLMVRQRIPFFVVMLVTLLTMTCFYWPVSHPWYDQSAHLWGILAVAVLTVRLPLRESRSTFGVGLFCGIMAITAIMAKTNVGLAYGIIFLIVFLVSSQRIKAVAGYSVGALISLFLFALLIGQPEKYLEQVIVGYGFYKSSRILELLNPLNWLVNFYWIPAAVAAVFLTSLDKTHRELCALFWGTMFVAIFSTYTSNLIRPANVPLWGTIMAMTFILLYKVPEKPLHDITAKLFIGLFRIKDAVEVQYNDLFSPEKRPNIDFLNIFNGEKVNKSAIYFLTIFSLGLIALFAYYGITLKVWTYMRPDPVGHYAIRTKALEGWLCDQEKGELLDMAADYIQKYIPTKDSLLILSDMQIIYAVTGRVSFPGVPFLFQAGDLPVPGRQVQQVKENIFRQPPDWILWNMEEPTFGRKLMQYLGIWERIQADYFPFKRWQFHVLLKRNPS